MNMSETLSSLKRERERERVRHEIPENAKKKEKRVISEKNKK